jgi:hypothetical protein
MSSLADAAFAMFALQQPLTLGQIAAASADRRLPMADPQTPDWFAAMATGGSSLLDIAPELRALPTEPAPQPAPDVQGLDLVRIYSDQIAQVDRVDQASSTKEAEDPSAGIRVSEASHQIGLLKELEGLDD